MYDTKEDMSLSSVQKCYEERAEEISNSLKNDMDREQMIALQHTLKEYKHIASWLDELSELRNIIKKQYESINQKVYVSDEGTNPVNQDKVSSNK